MPRAHLVRWWFAQNAGIITVELQTSDGERKIFRLDLTVFHQLQLYTGAEISDDVFATLERTDRALNFVGRLKRFLTYRMRASGEVAKRLHTLGATDDDIRAVLDLLHRSGTIDDERFARAYVRDAVQLKKLSARAIRTRLRALGIAEAIVDEAIAVEYPSAQEEERARDLATKALRRNANLPVEQRARRARDYLLRRGFPPDIVRRVLRSLT
jgi:regulatory protein